MRFEAWELHLAELGWPETFVQAYLHMLRAKNQGMDNAVPRSAAIIGATSFRRWVEVKLKPAVLDS